MIVTTTENIPNKEITEIIGIARGSTVRARNIGRDIFAGLKNIVGGEQMMKKSRKPDIMADAAHWILTQDAKACTGNFFIDEDLLRESGVTDFEHYSVVPGSDLFPDFFI